MRPVRLTLQAFGPYPGRVTIDFRKAVDGGLFGIYGQTGSGKSTIFSAMTFALFGEAAKAEQDTSSLRSDHADADMLTEVEFVFDIAERRYAALRRPEQMRLKTRGGGETRSAHEAYLFDATGLEPKEISPAQRGRIIAEKKVRDVDAAIEDLLGYGARQFRQIVLLPQGRFEAFLAAKTKERLEILRELFDVSRYEALMADLKSEAEAAERHVREELALSARQLNAEGFESFDALDEGIEAAQAHIAWLELALTAAKAETEAAEKRLRLAETLEEKFTAADQAQVRLTELEASRQQIEALAGQVRQADLARSLLDPEERVKDAKTETAKAAGALQSAAESAGKTAKAAAEAELAVQREEARSDEVETLRRQKDDLVRYGRVLEAAAGSGETATAALKAQEEAAAKLETAQGRLASLRQERDRAQETLRVQRETEKQRAALNDQHRDLDARHAAASAYAKAVEEVAGARNAEERQRLAHAAALEQAGQAQRDLEAAEHSLSGAQALHLAARLEPGSPCPVCGATEHPAPATGEAGNAGLDAAFRKAKAAWEAASREVGQAAEVLAGLRARLAEREARLAALSQPEEPAPLLAGQLKQLADALASLGPEADAASAEDGLAALDRQLAALELERDGLRDQFEESRNRATAAISARDSQLASVPADLRSPQALAAALNKASQALDKLVAGQMAAAAAARAARETALTAARDLENARAQHLICQERQQKAEEAFSARLAAAGLSLDGFQSLKPAIATLEADRQAVEAFWREHRSAEDAAKAAVLAIGDASRPETARLRAEHAAFAAKLTLAAEERAAAASRSAHLERVKTSLSGMIEKAKAAEAESAPLRALAALVNGANPQKLTLETFAIGAMFDQVLEAANLRLAPMTASRYRLERDMDGTGGGKRGLGIQVFDMHTGKARSTGTLSGGESFIAALALALGLADVVEGASGKVRLDTIFIDEGFGSLDTENGSGTLDQVLQVLGALVSQNRAVGLISHVPQVQEAIPNGFHIRKSAAGSSIEERGLP
ncbi:AAA family ATPase [Pannonibacter phragmitetus]|uniref:AAA family ATPase n=1 Tax=Pannonibacter phragmitetus TaxID=121719 RepID=UPI003D2F21CF